MKFSTYATLVNYSYYGIHLLYYCKYIMYCDMPACLPISIFTSSLPGLSRASSIRSGLLVIPKLKVNNKISII